MDYVHVFAGLMAGVLYSLLGWLKNSRRFHDLKIEPREIVEKIIEEKKDLAKFEEALAVVVFLTWSRIYGEKMYFNWSEFFKTVIHGLLLGFLIGFLEIPLDTAISLTSQIGLITVTRRACSVIKHIASRKILKTII